MSESPKQWSVMLDGECLNGIASAQLKQLAESGKITPETPVMREGMSDWVPASRIKHLFAKSQKNGALQKEPIPSTRVARTNQTVNHGDVSTSSASNGKLAKAAMITSIPGLCCFPAGLAAIVLGGIALLKIRSSENKVGQAQALLGITLGCISLLVFVLILTMNNGQDRTPQSNNSLSGNIQRSTNQPKPESPDQANKILSPIDATVRISTISKNAYSAYKRGDKEFALRLMGNIDTEALQNAINLPQALALRESILSDNPIIWTPLENSLRIEADTIESPKFADWVIVQDIRFREYNSLEEIQAEAQRIQPILEKWLPSGLKTLERIDGKIQELRQETNAERVRFRTKTILKHSGNWLRQVAASTQDRIIATIHLEDAEPLDIGLSQVDAIARMVGASEKIRHKPTPEVILFSADWEHDVFTPRMAANYRGRNIFLRPSIWIAVDKRGQVWWITIYQDIEHKLDENEYLSAMTGNEKLKRKLETLSQEGFQDALQTLSSWSKELIRLSSDEHAEDILRWLDSLAINIISEGTSDESTAFFFKQYTKSFGKLKANVFFNRAQSLDGKANLDNATLGLSLSVDPTQYNLKGN